VPGGLSRSLVVRKTERIEMMVERAHVFPEGLSKRVVKGQQL
jgi:hypothetical protein